MNHLGWLNYRLFMVFTSLMCSKGHSIVHAIESVTKYVSCFAHKMQMTNFADCCSKLNNAEEYVIV